MLFRSDGLATLYLDPSGLLGSIAGSTSGASSAIAGQLFSSSGFRPVAAAANAQADGFTLDFASPGAKASGVAAGDGPAALTRVPGDSWLGIGIGNLGPRVEQALNQFATLGALGGVNLDQVLSQLKQQSGLDVRKDVIDWMGDAAIFVRGTSKADLGGGVIIHSSDPAATVRGVQGIARLLRAGGRTVTALHGLPGVAAGASIRLTSGGEVLLAAAGDRFIATYGRPAMLAALKPSATLGDCPGFQAAASRLGGGLKPSLFLAPQPALQLIEATSAGSSASYRSVRPYLAAFESVVAGGRRAGDVSKGRVVIAVR